MKVKYNNFPKQYAGEKVHPVVRAIATTGLVALIVASPFYAVTKALSKAKDYFTGRDLDDIPSCEEFGDTVKLCSHITLYGRMPEIEGGESQDSKRLDDYL